MSRFSHVSPLIRLGIDFTLQADDHVYKQTKAALAEYGWPDDFRRDDWMQDIAGLDEQWEGEAVEIRERNRETRVAARAMSRLNVGEAQGDAANAG